MGQLTSGPSLHASISDLADETAFDPSGAVRSVQSATVVLPDDELNQMWTPGNLERLARTYWRYLTRITLGLIRVHYRPDGRDIVLLARPLRLLSFSAPDYDLEADGGAVTWKIAGGLLVARPGQGFLRIAVRLLGPVAGGDGPSGSSAIRVDVEVSNFYPAIAVWISRHLYSWTQSRIHVLVTHGFLRSLAKGDLEPSVTGRFAQP